MTDRPVLTSRVTVSLTTDENEQMERRALEQRVSKSWLIRSLVCAYLETEG